MNMKLTHKLLPAVFLLAACGQDNVAHEGELASAEVLEAASALAEPDRSHRGPRTSTLYQCRSTATRGGQVAVTVSEARGPNRYSVEISRQRGPRAQTETRAAVGRDTRRGLDLVLVGQARRGQRETLTIRDSRRGSRATGTLTLQSRRGTRDIALTCRETTRPERPTRPSRPGRPGPRR